MALKLSVIGCGYLGAVHASAMAKLGHDVVGIDIDPEKIRHLNAGEAPFFEPGLSEMLANGRASGRLTFSTEHAKAGSATVHFIAVGTPQRKDGHAADLSFVYEAIDGLLPFLKPGDLVVGKSTVPVGTATDLAQRIVDTGAILVWNPEFLREGFAVQDTISPDRIVYGVPPGLLGSRAIEILDKVYESALSQGTPRIVTNLATAELVKVSANAFLATKISFINAMAEIAESTGADVTQLADAIGLDARIGRRFLGAGIGFGGGCLPKDIRAFAARAEELGRGTSVRFLREVDAINQRRRDRAVELALDALQGQPVGKKVAILGAAFKPHSDDIRDSPALEIAVRLNGLGANVFVTDPQALENSKRAHPQLIYSTSVETTLRDAEVVLLVTEWDEYRQQLDPAWAASLVRHSIIIDGRNCLDSISWRAAGWSYIGMGRP